MPDREHPARQPRSHLRVVDLRDPSGLLDRIEAQPEALRVLFTPVADLSRAVAAGYEAVVAFQGGDPAAPRSFSDPLHPATAGRMEAPLVRRILQVRDQLPGSAFLMVNVSAPALCSPELPAVLAEAGPLERIVLVVADDTQGEQAGTVRAALDRVREAGGLVAVDETGSGYASLRQLLSLRPDFVRIGGDFTTELDRDQAKAAVVETLGALASRIDAWLIASGIPGRQELGALRRMGVPLGQGPVIGGASETPEPLPDRVADAIRQATPPTEARDTVAALVEARPALPWGGSLEEIADAFLEDPRHDVVVLVDERNRPLALAERAALLRGEPFERPVMRITPTSALKAVARRAAARPLLERFHPLVACDRRGVYLGVVRVEQLLDALARDED
jgi:EAL domain-containing protein (putative c-di-GMP-specific phosphodiesterase class I)